MLEKKHIWLIGASHGIGEALAKELAARGAILALSARSKDKLEALRQELPNKEQHIVLPLDVTDANTCEQMTADLQAQWKHIDSIHYLAGAYKPMAAMEMELTTCQQTLDVNLGGVFNLLAAVLPWLKAQKTGQLVLFGSVAGYRGLPNALAYGASKAAVNHLAEILAIELPPQGIDVRLVSPGFVKSRPTDQNEFDMPAIQTPEQAAKAICKGLEGKAFEIHFPKRFTLVLKALGLLPFSLYAKLMRKAVL